MIDTVEALRALYAQPKERAVRKQLDRLDRHCRRFVELSPFVVLASRGRSGALDASPRGGEPGFVRIVDERTLLVPDSPGNNRLDTLTNVVETGEVGLLFLVPGVDESLRVNGAARLDDDPQVCARLADARRTPKLVIEVAVRDAYLHCAKSLMRARLWGEENRVERSTLPTMGRMLNEQMGSSAPGETQEEMLARYETEL